MSALIGDGKVGEVPLAHMNQFCAKDDTARWAAYQNHDLGSRELGHLKFLAVGPRCTVKSAPAGRLPDTPREINWRYWFVGYVNLKTGEVEPPEPEETLDNFEAGG